jgi:hypothetical protein
MDPAANVDRQLELARAIIAAGEAGERQSAECADDALELAELVLALDEWLSKGGWSPWTVTDA